MVQTVSEPRFQAIQGESLGESRNPEPLNLEKSTVERTPLQEWLVTGFLSNEHTRELSDSPTMQDLGRGMNLIAAESRQLDWSWSIMRVNQDIERLLIMPEPLDNQSTKHELLERVERLKDAVRGVIMLPDGSNASLPEIDRSATQQAYRSLDEFSRVLRKDGTKFRDPALEDGPITAAGRNFEILQRVNTNLEILQAEILSAVNTRALEDAKKREEMWANGGGGPVMSK